MSGLLTWILIFVIALVLVPVCVLMVQVLCALLPRRSVTPPGILRRPPLAVLIPAHNESLVIDATLKTVLPQLVNGDRLVVIADNCSDDTAHIAEANGAEVVERDDAFRQGKGYALDFGIRYLERDPAELVVIVDADCEVTPGSIDRIARTSASIGRPVQALYLMKSPKSAGTLAPIAEFAWIVKNRVRPMGFLRLGLPCQLMGTGMAIPWTAIRDARLASGHIVEDMKMGVDFARAGIPPLFCPEALVVSYFPASEEGTRSQRMRWEHGHLAMIVSEVPQLIWQSITGTGSGLLALALDMCVPPLALLLLIVLVLFGLSTVLALVNLSTAPLAMASVELLMLFSALILAWVRFGSESVSLSGLLGAIPYMLGKVSIYLKFVVRRQVEWVRSKRDGR